MEVVKSISEQLESVKYICGFGPIMISLAISMATSGKIKKKD